MWQLQNFIFRWLINVYNRSTSLHHLHHFIVIKIIIVVIIIIIIIIINMIIITVNYSPSKISRKVPILIAKNSNAMHSTIITFTIIIIITRTILILILLLTCLLTSSSSSLFRSRALATTFDLSIEIPLLVL